ncbi:pyridoxal-phosphate dependent enzyme [Nonomuraea longispora]|uniref:pyridoxal-phosphate dependent enzyme n=1 Tax=Nonomuraea longispora TaxID=1848320 RepID=UPI001FE44BD9|nr:pyridoxal-phosphate dependent enzyme [Nonomuraea longispora]
MHRRRAAVVTDLPLIPAAYVAQGDRDRRAAPSWGCRHPVPAALDDLLQVADDAVLVRESSIVAGMRMLLEDAGPVAEPSAALGVAAVMEDRDRFAGRHVATIVCGGNVALDAYHRWVRT